MSARSDPAAVGLAAPSPAATSPPAADAADAVVARAGASEEIAEFEGAPEPGLTLFVQSSWSASLRSGLPTERDAVLCRLLACDGERSWEGELRRGDLAGPLDESWGDPSNLKLLLEALSSRPASTEEKPAAEFTACTFAPVDTVFGTVATATAAAAFAKPAVPRSEAIWTCMESLYEAPLELSVRFYFSEGPVMAVRNVVLPRGDLSVGLLRFFALAHGSQLAADACVKAAEEESSGLLQRQEQLQSQLEALPAELEEEEERLLAEFVQVLNAQKRRCRVLWEARQAELASEQAELASAEAELASAQAEYASAQEFASYTFAKLEPEPQAMDTVCSLTFASQPPPPPRPAPAETVPENNTGSAFTIPLTLGMCELGERSLMRAATATMGARAAATLGGPRPTPSQVAELTRALTSKRKR